MFYKPCSVLLYYKRWLASYASSNHLSTSKCLSLFQLYSLIKDAPTNIWVTHSWGLPRSTQVVSYLTTSLWHFQGQYLIQKDLGIIPAVNLRRLPWLMILPSTNTTNISACVSMDFPLHVKIRAAITQTFILQLLIVFIFLIIVNRY